MNARILELIKNPDIIQIQDLDLLNAEVKNHPYLQSIRALQLIGNHQFNADNYQKELSITAAYTTDKKILYQLINKKSFESSVAENAIVNDEREEISAVFQPDEKIAEQEKLEVENEPAHLEDVSFEPKETAKPVFVEGVLNRILFEGEEDFLERETEDIDIESTLESGKLVTRKAEKKMEAELEVEKNTEKISEPGTGVQEKIEIPETESLAAETIIKEDQIQEEKDTIEDPSQISFHGTEEFLPEVKINSTKIQEPEEATENESVNAETIIKQDQIQEEKDTVEDPSQISFHGTEEFLPDVTIKPTAVEQPKYEAPKPKLSKQEEEMQRLIAEVEAKMKASKKPTKKETEPVENADINFSSTQEFKVEPVKTEEEIAEKSINEKTESAEIIEQPKEKIAEEKPQEKPAPIVETATPQNTSWKPMSISAPTPDSLIQKKAVETPSESAQKVDVKEISPTIETKKTEERPVFNVSFFTPNVSSIESKKAEGEENIVENQNEVSEESNVPIFINTWQNWLKIERKEPVAEVEPISKEELKNTVIEKFIEKEPKISKLKDESDFVVKERGSNISHLMTETLANLYVEQKLYAKAIKGYEILIEKHPHKEEIFNEKIQEIKDLRKNS